MKYVDLHIRSRYSGGKDSPAELVKKVKDAGVAAFSVTDVLDLSALKECGELAAAEGLEFVPGVDIPVCLDRYGLCFHLLGYFFDPENGKLQEFLAGAKEKIPALGQAAAALREAGGLVALADPRSCGLSGFALDGFMQMVRCCGVEFMEVLYTGYSPDDSQFWLDTAKEWSMDPVGGSGYGNPELNAIPGEPEVDYEVLSWMRECLRKPGEG